MFAAQLGGSHDVGPVVGKGGNCDGFLDEVKSHEMGQGGVKMVVRGARGAVMVTAILTSGEPWTSPHEHQLTSTQLITPGRRSTTGGSTVEGHRDRREREARPGRGPLGHLIDWYGQPANPPLASW